MGSPRGVAGGRREGSLPIYCTCPSYLGNSLMNGTLELEHSSRIAAFVSMCCSYGDPYTQAAAAGQMSNMYRPLPYDRPEQCFYCGSHSHLAYQCPDHKRSLLSYTPFSPFFISHFLIRFDRFHNSPFLQWLTQGRAYMGTVGPHGRLIRRMPHVKT